MSETSRFRPARSPGFIIWGARILNRLDLAWRNRLRIEPRDLEVLRGLPQGLGSILVSNHADETDMRACLELSRRCGRRFLYMMNREAFDEGFGIAGWWLQRLGAFSVERGGRNEEAKRYAIDAVKRGQEVLVIFPEGEIHYLNDLVQPFKSGSVDIGMQAVVEARETRPDWTAFLVPMAIKYRYRHPIVPLLEERTRQMEQNLFRRIHSDPLPRRLIIIMAELLHRQELSHHLKPDPDHLARLSERVQEVRQELLARMEDHYAGSAVDDRSPTRDRTWRLGSSLREMLRQGPRFSAESRAGFRIDLAGLKRVAQMGSWQPQYVDLDPSQERLAEMVLKLEREVYGIKRPRQLANRDVFLRIGQPIDLGRYVAPYLQDAQAVRHEVAERLRDEIQALINSILVAPARA
ncbi:MAG: lysophospholipid acyltransferase family protein [Isosphaeraceae bacterium]